jgi:hypothetical protein
VDAVDAAELPRQPLESGAAMRFARRVARQVEVAAEIRVRIVEGLAFAVIAPIESRRKERREMREDGRDAD